MNIKLAALLSAVSLSGAAFAQFNVLPSDLVVLSVDGGASAPSALGNQVVLKNFTNAGSLKGSVTTNTFINGASTASGALNFDPITQTYWFAGHANAVASGTIQSSANATTRRIEGFTKTGTLVSTTDYAAAVLNGSDNIRSAAVTNGQLVTAGTGANAGTRTGTLGGTLSIVSGAITNTRTASFWDGDVIYSTGSGTPSIFRGGATPVDLIATKPGTAMSPYEFQFTADRTVLYVADDSTANGGVLRFNRNANNLYDFAYRMTITPTLGGASAITGARGLAINVDGSIVVSTSHSSDVANAIVSFADPGVAGTVGTLVVAAGTNERFRGVEIVPEPASFAIMAVGLAGIAARRRRK